MKYLIILFSVLLMSASASQVNNYINGNVLTADQLNSEFSNIYTTLNSIDDENVAEGADISPDKIATSIAGDGMARQVDGSLDVNVDGTTVKVIGGEVVIDELPGSAIGTGQVGTIQLEDGGVQKIDLAVKATSPTATLGNIALSLGTGAGELEYLTGSTGTLPNHTINLTTNGGPVQIMLAQASDNTQAYVECEDATTDPCILELLRDGGTVIEIPFYTQGGKYRLPPAAFTFIDTPPAGTYEYRMRYEVPSATALRVLNVRLMAYEL
jgi:hypothetical protein